jgi:hypothetical protein
MGICVCTAFPACGSPTSGETELENNLFDLFEKIKTWGHLFDLQLKSCTDFTDIPQRGIPGIGSRYVEVVSLGGEVQREEVDHDQSLLRYIII